MINQPAKATAKALSTPLSVASNQTVGLARHFLTTIVTCSKDVGLSGGLIFMDRKMMSRLSFLVG